MKLKLLFALLIITISNAQTQIGQDIAGYSHDTTFGSAVALSNTGNVLAISSEYYNLNGTEDGLVRVFANTSGNWSQIGQDIIGPTGARIGYRVKLSNDGSVLAVSNYYNTIKIYKNVNNNWIQIGQDIKEYGHSISLSGDGSTIAIGDGIINKNYPSPVTIYKNISGNWMKVGSIFSPSPSFFHGFSVALSENGDIVAFSDYTSLQPASAPGIAKIFVYENVNNNWIQVGNTITCNPNDLNMGYRLDISSDGSTLAVTANNDQPTTQNSGSVYIYKNINNSWTQMGNEIVGHVPNERYSQNVAISGSGNVVVVGSMTNATTLTGRLEIFEYLQGNWVKKREINDPTGKLIFWAFALSRDGNSLAFRNSGNISVNSKPIVNSKEKQIATYSSEKNYGAKNTSSSIRVIDISSILSSDHFILENFNIYPNPTTDILNIELEDNLVLEKVLMYNTIGQLIKETSEKTINVSGLAKGIYSVQVITNQGKATKKIIVK